MKNKTSVRSQRPRTYTDSVIAPRHVFAIICDALLLRRNIHLQYPILRGTHHHDRRRRRMPFIMRTISISRV
jgi:hypothetical protein